MHITIFVLLGGLSVLLVGLGLLGTLLGVRATIEQFTNTQTGIVMAGYYLGYIIGTWGGPGIVRRVGHIRTFAAFAALAGGQILLVVYDPATLSPFALATVLIGLAIIPIAVTRVSEPAIDIHEHLSLLQLYKLSPLGAAGVIGAGAVNGAFWGMTAVFGARIGLQETQIALLMSATIVGGALLQLPIGHLSDRHDRRTVLLLVSLCGAVVAAIAGFMVQREIPGLNLVAFLYGGLMFSLYAICVAHTNDHLRRDRYWRQPAACCCSTAWARFSAPWPEAGSWTSPVSRGYPIFPPRFCCSSASTASTE